MLISGIFAALKRCFWHIRSCILSCSDEMATTINGYLGDRKLGIDTSYSNDRITQSMNGDAQKYEPTKYATLKTLPNYLKISENDVFVDYGCGKGRVVFFIATQTLKKVIGVDLDKKMIDIAKNNLKNFTAKNSPIEILNLEATKLDPSEGTIFFLFNPFGENTLKAVIDNIKKSSIANPRRIRIVYHEPLYQSVFEKQDWLILEKVIDNIKPKIFVWNNKLLK